MGGTKLYFQTRILFVSFLATVILSIFIIPILRRLKVGQIERDDGPKSHFKKEGTPTMGGIIIALGIIIGTIGGYVYYFSKEPEVGKRIFPLILITIGFGIIGFIDDFKKLVLKDTKGLKASYKMLGLLIISVFYVIYLVKSLGIGTETFIPFIKQYITLPMWIYIPFAVFVLLAMTNAVNLTDGIDRAVYKSFSNNGYMFNCCCNNIGCERNNCIWKYNSWSLLRIFNI